MSVGNGARTSESLSTGDAAGIELGVFARCFPVQPPNQLAVAIAGHGFTTMQLNLSAIGEPTIPDERTLAGIDLATISSELRSTGLDIWGLSASYNLAHPDQVLAAAQTSAAAGLIRRAPELGVTAVTLCTGSRDAANMWRAHPDNDSAEAWADMLRNLEPLLDAGDEAGVLLAIEPEPGNVISGAEMAVRLIEELGSRADQIGLILDPANLVGEKVRALHESILRDAFDRLGEKAICVHAKDVVPWDARVSGETGLDFGLVRELHAALPHRVPIIIQDADLTNLEAVRALVIGAS